MIGSAGSVAQAARVISSGSSSSAQEAALEDQIKAKEAEAKKITDQAESAKAALEIAAMKAKLAALQAADNKTVDAPVHPAQAADLAQQAGFETAEPTTTGKSYWI